jgi:hypothetical protein
LFEVHVSSFIFFCVSYARLLAGSDDRCLKNIPLRISATIYVARPDVILNINGLKRGKMPLHVLLFNTLNEFDILICSLILVVKETLEKQYFC